MLKRKNNDQYSSIMGNFDWLLFSPNHGCKIFSFVLH